MRTQFHMPYFLITALYCAGIFWLSNQSDPPKPTVSFPGEDKAAHAVLYGGLAAVVSVGIRRSNVSPARAVQVYAPIAFAVAYGLSDETHQLFVPERTFDLFDLAADGAGASLAQAVLCGWLWRETREGRAEARPSGE